MLHKPGSFTEQERHEMNQHVKFSAHYAHTYYLGPDATKIILRHHERCDGSGYPFGIKVEDIETKILMVADVFDALISDRAYRKGYSAFQALQIIDEEKEKYDKFVLECFSNIAEDIVMKYEIELFPELNSNSVDIAGSKILMGMDSIKSADHKIVFKNFTRSMNLNRKVSGN